MLTAVLPPPLQPSSEIVRTMLRMSEVTTASGAAHTQPLSSHEVRPPQPPHCTALSGAAWAGMGRGGGRGCPSVLQCLCVPQWGQEMSVCPAVSVCPSVGSGGVCRSSMGSGRRCLYVLQCLCVLYGVGRCLCVLHCLCVVNGVRQEVSVCPAVSVCPVAGVRQEASVCPSVGSGRGCPSVRPAVSVCPAVSVRPSRSRSPSLSAADSPPADFPLTAAGI